MDLLLFIEPKLGVKKLIKYLTQAKDVKENTNYSLQQNFVELI